MDVQTQHRPPVPPARPDALDAAPSQTSKPRRRQGSPPSAIKTSKATDAHARSKKRSPNYVHTQAASPAVISNLIDQLSAISIPAHDHFENLLVGYSNGNSSSAQASVHSGRNSFGGHDGSSVDHSAYDASLREQNDTFPDDACEPPVVRTSKPPSGYSSLTAPKKKSKAHSLGSYIGQNSASSVSLHSTHSNHSANSFGNISIEVGAPKAPSGGSARSSAESKRSAKGHKGLMYMSSRERLRMKETERKRHTAHGAEDVSSHDSPRKASVQLFPYEDTIKEEPTSRDENKPFQGESSRFAQRFLDRSGSPRRLRINLVDGPISDSPSSPGIIPERGSSLRHSGSPSRKSKKNRTSASSRKEQLKPDATQEEKEPHKEEKMADPEAEKQNKILQELEKEDNEVAQRIRELREQKLRREKIAGKQAVNVDAGVAPSSVPQVSVIPSPEQSPTSTVSSASGKRVQDAGKAHKVLGITREEAASDKLADNDKQIPQTVIRKAAPPGPIAIPQAQAPRHVRHRSLTVNDGDDLTPLPINYTLALQRLEEVSPPSPVTEAPRAPSPPPPSISVASSKETQSSAISLKRSNSVAAVGGRSAISRKATSSSLMGASRGHQHSSSVSEKSAVQKAPSLRAASADVSVRHHSMINPLPASNSSQLSRRHTLTKKRWSHPDLPAKAEKRHNDKVDRAEAKANAMGIGAVQRPPRPIMEERPLSVDPIDNEVDSFLDADRLSQKIRHPQTGRIISFSEVGDPTGFAVFVCVGMGLTRYVMAFYDQLAATLKLRLITPDRPGIGGSQVDPTGTPLSWPGK